ncbi:MAG: ATP-binding protein [Prevotellaceae bacterium]|nr:ATP-binding protein [Prevotellaceae bacterium]
METKMTIPYGIADFAELRDNGYYYVDKTRFIPYLERYKAPIFLRPRRFGKSLHVSMLSYYYDVNTADRFDTLFAGTYIGNAPTSRKNQYMVLRLNFSQLSVSGTMEEMKADFNRVVCPALRNFVYRYERFFEGFTFDGEGNATNMLSNILSWIPGRKIPLPYILIDEYDNFTNQLLTASKNTLYKSVTGGDSFFRTFFKTIKSGLDGGTINTCFCTGVLPVTVDDLTSGYNLAEFLTLEDDFIEMLGFNHDEAATYLRYVMERYGSDKTSFEELWALILNNYDGYRFQPEGRLLFNSTMLTYFFKKFAVSHGRVPNEMTDNNLRTDTDWIRRLTRNQKNAQAVLDKLLIDDELTYSQLNLLSQFDRHTFFSANFYPVSLFYLGMTTLKNRSKMSLPNLSMRSIYMHHYNVVNRVNTDDNLYQSVYDAFEEGDDRLEPLVENYFQAYLQSLPAQVFDKVNENFVRCSFFGLASHFLSSCYSFSIEPNLPSGRPDLVLIGLPDTDYHNDCRVLEFKYFKKRDLDKAESYTVPRAEDIAQVKGYAADINRQFTNYRMRTYVVYIAANKWCKVWEVSNMSRSRR